MARDTLPLQLTQDGINSPVLLLGGVDITQHVARDGLRIEYGDEEAWPGPKVTLTFAPGGLDLDLDIALLSRIVADARTREA